jgi:hypothetical protein
LGARRLRPSPRPPLHRPHAPPGRSSPPDEPDANLTLYGFGKLVAELLERLELSNVTLIQNDHAAALVVAVEWPQRIGRLVISSCEAFEITRQESPARTSR